jgi:hypothetical protein
MHANMISLAEVEDMYKVTCIPCISFVVHLTNHDIVFTWQGVQHWVEIFYTYDVQNITYLHEDNNQPDITESYQTETTGNPHDAPLVEPREEAEHALVAQPRQQASQGSYSTWKVYHCD